MATATLQTTNGTATATVSPLAVMGQRYNIDPGKLLGVLKSTVIKGKEGGPAPTNEEIAAFVIVANQYSLNPFTRQIYAFVQNGAVVPIVGIDGWAHLVNSHPEFDGVEFEERFDAKGALESVTCTMFHSKRNHPVKVTEWLNECFRPTQPWKGMPKRMLRHKAFMQAARICFSLTGLFDEDEAIDIQRNQVAAAVNQAASPAADKAKEKLASKPAPVVDVEPEVEPEQEPAREIGDEPEESEGQQM